MDIIEYFNTLQIEPLKRQAPLEITENDETLSDVAGVWKEGKEAIRLVIKARCDVLMNRLITTDTPYNVQITRQTLFEVAGILKDFESLSAEFSKRELKKEE